MKLADFQVAFPEPESRVSHAHSPARAMEPDDIKQDSFAAIPDWVNRSNKFGAGEKCCFAVIYAEIRKTGRRSCFVQQYVLARKLGIDERTVRRHVAALRDGGLIGVVDNRSKGRPNEYYVLHNDLRSKAEKPVENACPEGGVAGTEQADSSGQPRPMGSLDLRTAASSSKKKKNSDQKIELSFGELAEAALRFASFPQTPANQSGQAEQTEEKGSAADASRQPTCKDNTYMGFDDPPEEDSGAMRRARAQAAMDAREARTKQDATKRDKKRVERLDARGAGGELYPAIKALEGQWRTLVAARIGVAPIQWGTKDKRQAGDLIKRVSLEELGEAIEFTVTNWDRLFPHLVGPKRSVEAPSWGFFFNLADRILMISKVWSKHKETWTAINKWRKTADEYDIMPNELSDLLDAANEDLRKNCGFKL